MQEAPRLQLGDAALRPRGFNYSLPCVFFPREWRGIPQPSPAQRGSAEPRQPPPKNNKALELEMCWKFTLPQKNVRNPYCLDRDLLGIAR